MLKCNSSSSLLRKLAWSVEPSTNTILYTFVEQKKSNNKKQFQVFKLRGNVKITFLFNIIWHDNNTYYQLFTSLTKRLKIFSFKRTEFGGISNINPLDRSLNCR